MKYRYTSGLTKSVGHSTCTMYFPFRQEIDNIIHTCMVAIATMLLSLVPQITLATFWKVHSNEVSDTCITRVLRRECPALRAKFRPLPWAANPLIQSTLLHTTLHFIRGGPDKEFVNDDKGTCVSTCREIIYTRDRCTVAIDWIDRDGVIVDDDAPIMLHFPGLGQCQPTIGFGAMIVGAMQEHCNARAASVIYPGFSEHILDSHKIPGSAYVATDDVGAVLRHVRLCFPTARIIIVGCSFGSAMVSNWLARNSDEAVTLNIALTLLYAYGHSAAQAVWAADNDALGGVTSASVVKMWKKLFLNDPQNLAHVQKLEIAYPRFSIEALRLAKTVRDWDIACLPIYGFASIDEMFRESDPVDVFHQLHPTIPVVIINADDDWLCPSQRVKAAIPSLYGRMENVAIFETNGGGHLGWVDRLDIYKDQHNARRRPLYMLYPANILHRVFCGSTATQEDDTTGSHCRWITTFTTQILDAALNNKLDTQK